MFARITRTLKTLIGSPETRPSRRAPAARAAGRAHLTLEALEDRLALSHAAPVALPVKAVILSQKVAAVAAHEQLTNHSNPANEAARLALLNQMAEQALLKSAKSTPPPVSPAPAPSPPTVGGTVQPPTANPGSPGASVSLQGTLRTGVVAIGGETTGVILQTSAGTYELDLRNNPALVNAAAALNGQQAHVTGTLTVQPGVEIAERFIVHVATLERVPTPAPSPVPPPIKGPGYGQINPATYVPDLCTTASFSGTLGTDGHYSSFTIIGRNPATGTTVIISYSTGTPYGAPVYHWAVTVESQTLGNWGNQCSVSQPYYADFLPLPVTYNQNGNSPG